jgi:hypothetical protein
MKEVWQDLRSGLRARPAASLALAAVGLSVGVLSALANGMWVEAKLESQRLLAAWPPDRSTVLIPESVGQHETAMLLNRLPDGSWWAWHREENILWVSGTLPPELTPTEGVPLQPDLIARGTPAGLVSSDSSWTTGETASLQGIGFEVLGKTDLPGGASALLPAVLSFQQNPGPLQMEIRAPLRDILPVLADLPFFSELSLTDHQQKRTEARKGFRRLTLQLLTAAGAAALLTALILQSLIRLELRERRFEFALRRSLGAMPSDIRHQILTETVFITGLPSLLGVLLVVFFSSAPGWLPALVVPGWFVLCALPPAIHAASLPPHEALKEG